MPFTAIDHRLLKLRARRGGGLASYFGADAAAVESAVLDAFSAVGISGRSGVFSASESIADRLLVSGTVGGGVSNDGLLVSNYATYDPDAAQIQSFVINNTIPTSIGTGASVTFSSKQWWNGSLTPVARFRPPTINDSYSGFGNIYFWKGATKAVKQINIRWETLYSNLHCADAAWLPKLMILDCPNILSAADGVPKARALLFLAHMNEADNTALHIPNSLVFCPAQGTIRMFSDSNRVPAVQFSDLDVTHVSGYANMRQGLYVRSTAGVDDVGNPIVAASEYLCIEMRVNINATSDEPNGVIALRVYRRDGSWYERACAWNYWPDDANRPVVGANFISRIDTFGGGYYNHSNDANPDLWTEIGRCLTVATNYQPTVGRAWIGPPAGFVQQ